MATFKFKGLKCFLSKITILKRPTLNLKNQKSFNWAKLVDVNFVFSLNIHGN